MKKIFTFAASVLFASSVLAQGVALDANRVVTFYKDYDGTSFEQVKDQNGYAKTNNLLKYFGIVKPDGANQNKVKFFPINYDGGVPNDMNDITLTADYSDPETGFKVPAGRYTSLCNNDLKGSEKTITMYSTGTNTHISNLKKIVIYVAGIGAARTTTGSLYADGIRFNSTKIYDGDNALTNPVSGDAATTNWLSRYIYNGVVTSAETVPVYSQADGITENTYTQDKLFRIVINFKDAHDPDDATGVDGINVVSANSNDGSPEKAIDQALIDKTTGKATAEERIYNVCHKFVDPDGDATEGQGGKPGYYSYEWTWGANIGFAMQIKKSYNLFGIALICGDDDAKTYISHVKDANKATWEEVEVGPNPPAPEGLPGDANDDKAVSVADLASMASYILGEDVKINIKNADVNGDNVITVADLAAVANIILGGE